MHFIPENLDRYCCDMSENEPALLHQLYRETYQKVLQPRMLSGHFQGRLLSLLSKLLRPKYILEIGTYTGYSALCLAEGLRPDGQLITIDKNEELEPLVNKYFGLSGFGHQLEFKIGKAIDIIPNLEFQPDLVFIDADKSAYQQYFDLVIDRMPSGGVILADNVLWSGKVVEALDPKDLDTAALLAFNAHIQRDPRVENVLMPIRDGLQLIRKK
ncbi:MAG TPA: class I SAM-dependent methyltransferase [Luteibaculaceae bacterium]|nr:class I SAM-dependent methyltransferase [Luteibaculaceae bacterium]